MVDRHHTSAPRQLGPNRLTKVGVLRVHEPFVHTPFGEPLIDAGVASFSASLIG